MPTNHSSIHTHSLFLFFLRNNVFLIKEINELCRELKLTCSQVYDLEAALKLTKKIQLKRSQRQVMSPGAKGNGHLGQGTNGSHKHVSLWLPRPRLLGVLLCQITWPSGSLSMPHSCSPKDLWGPYHIQQKSLGLAMVSEFRIFQILEHIVYRILHDSPRRVWYSALKSNRWIFLSWNIWTLKHIHPKLHHL